jgi:uncharacterized protein (TIGR03435 family)
MIGALTNHLWQSTLFVLAAALVAAALRRNGAHIRHAVWVVASLKFLVPFSLFVGLGGALASLTAPPVRLDASSVPQLSVVVDQITQPFASEVFAPSGAATTPAPTTSWAPRLFGAWACGFLVVARMRLRGWRRIRAAVRMSTRVNLAAPVPVGSSPALLEPGVVGLFRPVLLLPAGIENRLTPSQLDAVLAHELCHVRRRDNLTSAIHMVVEAMFWFHPLVWWVGARLIDERERACDEHVLRVCGQPQVYAESILNVCKLYAESPLSCVSGVGGSDLRKRVAAILVNRVGLPLSLARKATLAIAAALAIGLPLVAGGLIAPLRAAQAPAHQPAGHAAPKFEVVSIKPCVPVPAPEPGQRGPGGGAASPGYLHLRCMTLAQLAGIASGTVDDFLSIYLRNRPDGGFKAVRGGPAWVATDRFTIEARAEGAPDPTPTRDRTSGAPDRKTLQGPMLRALLEDRFQLRMHRATEDQPIYVMTVAAGGLRIAPVAPGACLELDPEKLFAGQSIGDGPICGRLLTRAPFKAAGAKIGKSPAAAGTSLAGFLSTIMDRPVLDQTGRDGRYDVAFDYTPDDTTPNWRSSFERGGLAPVQPPPSSGPTIFKALEQLGLKVAPTKWPVEYIVIDSAERPKPDLAPASADKSSGGPAPVQGARR